MQTFSNLSDPQTIMPEGPEVRTITDKLFARLTGKILLRMEWDSSSKYKDGLPRYEQLIEPYLPLTIENITCKGKQIFFHLTRIIMVNNQPQTYRIYLNSTLGMEGKWVWKSGGHSNFWLTIGDSIVEGFGQNKESLRLVIGKQNAYFDDFRHYGNLTVHDENCYQKKLGEIGADLLTEEISLPIWLEKVRNKRISGKQICDFLMDPKYFSGIGNYLKAEILYKARIKPDRALGDINDDEHRTILTHSMSTIRKSYSCGGLTVKSYWDPDGKKGTYPREIYGKSADSFGNLVIKSKFKDRRTTHWVPALQK